MNRLLHLVNDMLLHIYLYLYLPLYIYASKVDEWNKYLLGNR